MSFCSQRTKNLPFFLRNYPSLKRWDCSMFLPRAGWHMRKFTRVYLVFVFWSFHLSAARSWGHHHHLSPKETAVLFQTRTHTHTQNVTVMGESFGKCIPVLSLHLKIEKRPFSTAFTLTEVTHVWPDWCVHIGHLKVIFQWSFLTQTNNWQQSFLFSSFSETFVIGFCVFFKKNKTKNKYVGVNSKTFRLKKKKNQSIIRWIRMDKTIHS